MIGSRGRSGRRLAGVFLVLAMVGAACGQKSGVEGSAGDAVEVAPPSTPPTASNAPGPTTPPPSTQPGDTASPTSAPASAPATTAAAAKSYTPGDNDTEGVSDTEIVIGIHAPVTGASPIPQTSFEVGKDVYWKFLAASAPDKLFGRKVRVVFRDDEFNPQHAVQVCREMVEQEHAFMLIGAGGADQITACAQYASENGIPYFSSGVNEDGLAGLSTYFAVSPTYAQQAPMLVTEAKKRGFTKVGVVVIDTPSFDDFTKAFDTAAAAGGIDIAYSTRLNKNAAEPEQLSVVQDLKSAGVDGVILLSSPVVFIGLANQGLNQSYTPTWLGPGTTSGLNAVTSFGCPGVETGVFLNPTPQLDVIDALDPDFKQAYTDFGGGAAADDIGLGLWSLNKLIALMLEATGKDLGRAAFMNTLVSTPSFDNGIYPPVTYTADNHFGSTGMHLLDADCTQKVYTTAEQFVPVA